MTEQMKHYIKVFFFIFQLLGFPSPAQKIDTLKMVSVGQTLNDKSDLSCILQELHPRFKMGKCEYEMGIVGSEWFFNLLNKDLKTDIFNKIICVTSVEVSFFYHRAQCLVIQEWFFDGEDRSRTAKAYLDLGTVIWPGGADLAPDVMYDEIRRTGCWVVGVPSPRSSDLT